MKTTTSGQNCEISRREVQKLRKTKTASPHRGAKDLQLGRIKAAIVLERALQCNHTTETVVMQRGVYVKNRNAEYQVEWE